MFCEVCQRTLPPGKGGNSHFSSKKHKENIAILCKREEISGKSVFVTGFTPGTLEMQLADYFSRFGAISRIIDDKNNGIFAIIEFATMQTRDAVLAHKHHIMGNRHLTVKPRTTKKNARPTLEYVPRGEDEFPELQYLRQLPTVVEQMVKLLKIVSQTEEELRVKRQLCQKLQDILNQFYPGCSLNIFGSSVAGYGFRRCDLDLLLVLPNEEYLGKKTEFPSIDEVKKGAKTVKGMTIKGHLKFLQQVLKQFGPSCKNVLFINARCPILRFVHGTSRMPCDLSCNRGLSKYNTRLQRLYGELDSRTHLLIMTLRCWAKKRKLLGSGRQFTSYAFTLIVIFYLQTRQPPVAPSVECLANLAGEKREVGQWDCSFCEDPTLIPKSENQEPIDDTIVPVSYLVMEFDGRIPVFVGDKRKKQLLQGFFHYFSTFDYTMNAMSIRSGCVIPKAKLSSASKPSCIAVIDPFDLSHNITATISGQHVIYFLENLETASNICSSDSWGLYDIMLGECLKESVLSNPCVAANYFDILLDLDLLPKLFNVEPHTEDELKSMWIEKVSQLVVEIMSRGLLFECLEIDKDPSKSDDGNHEKRQRRDSGEVCKENPTKCRKLNPNGEDCVNVDDQNEGCGNTNVATASGDIHNCETAGNKQPDSCLLRQLHVRALYQTWNGRRREGKGFIFNDEQRNILDREEYISKQIVNHSTPLKNDCCRAQFECQLHRMDMGGLTLLKVAFECEERKKEFKSLLSFLKSYIPKMVRVIFDVESKQKC